MLPCLATLVSRNSTLAAIHNANFGNLQLNKHVPMFDNFDIDDSFICQFSDLTFNERVAMFDNFDVGKNLPIL